MIGIIIPPGQIKKMVEKTAAHVAKNGSQFEKALIQIQQHKPEFAFLLKQNPYRAYYDHMVAQYSRRMMAENQVGQAKQQQQPIQTKQQEEVKTLGQADYLEKVFEQLKEPDPDRFTAEIPQKLTKAEMAMIQHTAQYVSINGKNFLIALSERQKNNPQFQFLRSSSQNHQFFEKLIQAYNNILSLTSSSSKSSRQIEILQKYVASKDQILNKCKQIYEYYRLKQEQNKGKKNQEDNTNNKKQNLIDWNDFELVQTIVFDVPNKGSVQLDNRNGQSGTRLPLFSNKNMQEKIISQPKKKQLLQQCQVCGRNILATQMTKHLKTCIGGPKTNKKQGQNNQGNDVNITQNLQSLSQKRPDIFGGEGQKIRINEQQGQLDKNEKVIWDGQAPNITRATASAALLQNEQKKLRQKMKDNK